MAERDQAAMSVSSREGLLVPALIVGGGILLTMLPVTMIVPALKELVGVRFQVGAFWVHAFVSTSLIGATLFAPLAGAIIDRNAGRRRVLVAALVGNSLCFVALALAPTFWMLMMARFLEGIMHITALSAWMALGAELSPGGRSGRMMGALAGMLILGITVGVPLGGVIARASVEGVFWAAAAVSMVAALFSLLLRHRRPESTRPPGLKECLQVVHANPWLLLPYAYTFIDRLSIGVVVSTLTLYMTDIMALNPAQRGVLLSYFLLPFAFLSYPFGRLSDRVGRGWMMATGTLLFGLVYMSYGYVTGDTMRLTMMLSGVLSAAMFAPSLAICKDLSSREYYGVVFAGYNVAGSLGFMIGPLLGGGLLVTLQHSLSRIEAYRWTFVVVGSFEVLCALVSLPFLLRLIRSGRIK